MKDGWMDGWMNRGKDRQNKGGKERQTNRDKIDRRKMKKGRTDRQTDRQREDRKY